MAVSTNSAPEANSAPEIENAEEKEETKTMKKTPLFVFLDIDGVLNSNRSRRKFNSEDVFDTTCVLELNRIIERTGAQIIVHSNRRLTSGLAELRTLLSRNGVRGEVVDRVARPSELPGATQRHEFIQAWLDKHPGPRERRSVILDDERNMGDLLDQHIRTREAKGLDRAMADRAILILEGVTW